MSRMKSRYTNGAASRVAQLPIICNNRVQCDSKIYMLSVNHDHNQ